MTRLVGLERDEAGLRDALYVIGQVERAGGSEPALLNMTAAAKLVTAAALARHDGRQPIRLASEIGRRLPASCTALGKATLAALEPSDLAERLRGVEALPTLTRNSHRHVAQLLDDLDEVRRRGHAIDDEETAEGIICLGVAIPRRSGAEQYGVSVTLLKARADAARIDALAADLKRLARLLANPLIASRREGHGDARIP